MRVLSDAEFALLKRDKDGQIVGITESFEYNGHVFLSQVPLEIPVGMQIPESVESMVARLVRTEQQRAAMANSEVDWQEEMDDFEVDQEDPLSSYQAVDMVPELPAEDKAIEPKKKGGEKHGRKNTGAGKSRGAVEPAGDKTGSGGEEVIDPAESDATAD